MFWCSHGLCVYVSVDAFAGRAADTGVDTATVTLTGSRCSGAVRRLAARLDGREYLYVWPIASARQRLHMGACVRVCWYVCVSEDVCVAVRSLPAIGADEGTRRLTVDGDHRVRDGSTTVLILIALTQRYSSTSFTRVLLVKDTRTHISDVGHLSCVKATVGHNHHLYVLDNGRGANTRPWCVCMCHFVLTNRSPKTSQVQ